MTEKKQQYSERKQQYMDYIRNLSPKGVDIIDDDDVPIVISNCNKLTDHQWKTFFKHYLNWIRENIDNCLKLIPTPITFDKLSVLPFEKGGFDLVSFLKKNEIATSAENAKFIKTMKLYDGYLKNIKTLKESGEGTYLTALNRNVLYNLCEALEEQLKTHNILFYVTMIFFMEIMVCKKVFDAFITYTKSDSHIRNKSSSKSYYNIISDCRLQVFGITHNNTPSLVNNTVGYFITNYARRLLEFTIKYERNFIFGMKLPIVKNPKYTANLRIVNKPVLEHPDEFRKRPTVPYFIKGQKSPENPFRNTKEIIHELLKTPDILNQIKNFKNEFYDFHIENSTDYNMLNPSFDMKPKKKLSSPKKLTDEPVAKRTRKRGGNYIKNKISEYKEKLKNKKEQFKEYKTEKILLQIKLIKEKIKKYTEKLKL
jgi:hypothetical protein